MHQLQPVQPIHLHRTDGGISIRACDMRWAPRRLMQQAISTWPAHGAWVARAHRDAKALHEAHSHVDVRLRHQLVPDADRDTLSPGGQRRSHEQRRQILAAHRPTQLHLSVARACFALLLSHMMDGAPLSS